MNILPLLFTFLVTLFSSLTLTDSARPAETALLEINLDTGTDASLQSMLPGLFGLSRDDRPGLLETLQAIKQAAGDAKIGGLLLNTINCGYSGSDLWEIANAITQFRKESGKYAIAYTEDASFLLYPLLSACNEIVMSEDATLSFEGMALGFGFYKRLYDMLGIGYTELRYFDFKSANESYTRTEMSEANRFQYEAYLESVFNVNRDTIIQGRAMEEGEFERGLEDFLYTANSAKERGLVDSLGGKPLILDTAQRLGTALPAQFYTTWNSPSSVFYGASPYRLKKGPARIAVLEAFGASEYSSGMQIYHLVDTLDNLRYDSSVHGIVLRIDSGGGSAAAAKYLAQAVKEAAAVKPVIVSMAATAASGGYMIGMNATEIFATPHTLTGSIGVISGWTYSNGLDQMLGLNTEILKRGAHADLGLGLILPARDLTDTEQARYKALIMETYEQFVSTAADARGMSWDTMHALAQGRIYSGSDAVALGLVDSIGSIYDAVNRAAYLAGFDLRRGITVDTYQAPLEYDFLSLLDMISYRAANNGKAMTILPLELEQAGAMDWQSMTGW
jgi:protease-4